MSLISKKNVIDYTHAMIIGIIIIAFSWSILPMVILRENYIFTVHDGLDSYAAMVQNIHDNHMYFKLYEKMPYMHGLEGKYTMLSYNAYDFLNCMFGYLYGQILTRIIGVLMGFFSMKKLLGHIFHISNKLEADIIMLLSVAYAITPVAPNRMLGYASLPLSIVAFLSLKDRKSFSKLSIAIMFLPILSSFQAIFIFVLGIWFLVSIVEIVVTKKLNINLFISFLGMSVLTIFANYTTFWILISSSESNRSLRFSETIPAMDWELFCKYLFEGHYHTTALQTRVILPFLFMASIFVIFEYVIDKENKIKILCARIIIFGWLYWIITAFIRTFQEGGV